MQTIEKMTETVENTTETETAKVYEFRRLNSTDIFIMSNLISKIGVNEFSALFDKDAMKKLIGKLFKDKKEDDKKEDDNGQSETIVSIGISVALEIANVILTNLPKCEKEIYQILSQTSNLSVDEIKSLDLAVFAEMVIDFIKKDEFKNFIKVVSKLLK